MTATNLRVMPPGAGPTTIQVNGRTYTVANGSTQDVPYCDAIEMTASGWVTPAFDGGVGATALRPAAPYRGMLFQDTTVGAVIQWDGATWRNPMTGASV